MYIMSVCLFSALSRRVVALQISLIIICTNPLSGLYMVINVHRNRKVY